jgi:D-glycero-alpha-D-manno-heptose-7-phosphate kinase
LILKEAFMKFIKRVRAPVRIDFGGGTTDISPFRDEHGGCVLNAAIDKYVIGELITDNKTTKLSYYGNIPTSSGLGTSSAMNVVWTALITHMKDREKIAENVFKIEQSISESKINGKQDMYAAAFGGINFMEFKGNNVIVNPLKLKEKVVKELESRLVLVYSGKAHYSGSSNKAAIDNLIKGRNTDNLLRLKEIAIEMKNALLKGDLYMLANLMNSETNERRKLSKLTVSSQLQSVIDLGMKNRGIAAKVCGSGGGGSVLFFAEDRKKLINKFKGRVIDFKFDFEGLKWLCP